MGGKISKTAKASMKGSTKQDTRKRCPGCGEPMVATKVIRANRVNVISGMMHVDLQAGAMYWICQKCAYRERV